MSIRGLLLFVAQMNTARCIGERQQKEYLLQQLKQLNQQHFRWETTHPSGKGFSV